MKPRLAQASGVLAPPFPPRLHDFTAGSVVPRHARAEEPLLGEARDASPFASFWMAGYEGADPVDSARLSRSLSDITQHATQAAGDYERLAEFDIRTVRESAGWRLVERGGRYDFSTLETRARAARAAGLQILWTLGHYGWPGDVDVFSAAFVDRFARYARAMAGYLGDFAHDAPVYTPIDEISYLSWAVCESGHIHPSRAELRHRRGELQRQLVRAAVAACDAILEVDPRARFLHTDPMMHVVAPAARADLACAAARQGERQFHTWDMLAGRAEPQLGGHARYLDLVGVNYYRGNQWELGSERVLAWRLDDPRRKPLAELLAAAHRRYGRPIVIAETSHVGAGRGAWIQEIAAEAQIARENGVPVEGVCLYPILDRPARDASIDCHRSGLWRLEPTPGGTLRRHLDPHYAAALKNAQSAVQTAARSLKSIRPAALPVPPARIHPLSGAGPARSPMPVLRGPAAR